MIYTSPGNSLIDELDIVVIEIDDPMLVFDGGTTVHPDKLSVGPSVSVSVSVGPSVSVSIPSVGPSVTVSIGPSIGVSISWGPDPQ